MANTWSLLLLIGNPTNIYISGAFDISFGEYFVHMVLPTVAAGVVSLLVMLLVFGKRLKAPINAQAEIREINDKPLMTVALSHLIACIILLAISQYTGIEMWLISLGVSVSAVLSSIVVLTVRKKKLAPLSMAIKGMPFEIIPFVILRCIDKCLHHNHFLTVRCVEGMCYERTSHIIIVYLPESSQLGKVASSEFQVFDRRSCKFACHHIRSFEHARYVCLEHFGIFCEDIVKGHHVFSLNDRVFIDEYALGEVLYVVRNPDEVLCRLLEFPS